MRTGKCSLFATLFAAIFGLLATLQSGALPYAIAQTSRDQGDVMILVNLPEDLPSAFSDFYTTLNETLTTEGLSVVVQTDTLQNHALLDFPVTVAVTPAEAEGLRLTMLVRPPQDSLFSPGFEAELTAITLEGADLTQQAAPISALVTTLHSYSQGACDSSRMAAHRLNPPTGIHNPVILNYFTARCHYQTRDYAEAITLLSNGMENLARDGWYGVLWRATIAQAEAQSFQFDTALALDNQLIQQVAIDLRSCEPPPATDRLLAELHLLRGQHRLYLYEWDTVMADYDRAIKLVPDLSRAYYLRGLLNYTQNNRQAALNDLTHFLQMEASRPTSTQHPAILMLAETYQTELESLLATPAAN